MTGTLFVLGRTPDLSFSELQAFFPDIAIITPGIAFIQQSIDANAIINTLGGTVKIITVLNSFPAISNDILYQALIPYIRNNKITFGISTYSDKSLVSSKNLQALKVLFKSQGIIARFIETKHDRTLSSVVIEKQQVTELVIVTIKDEIIIGVTSAVQNFEEWNMRDWGRPAPNPAKGMLPPKVARMLINISKKYIHKKNLTLLDPFCGVGTIIAEGLLSGFSAIGSDIDHAALERAQKNILWLSQQYSFSDATFIESDATHIASKLHARIDVIITEPFMGSLKITEFNKQPAVEIIKNTMKGLEKLYIGCLRQWATFLETGAFVIIAFPAYSMFGKLFTVKNVIDRCEILGYTLVEGPHEYSRPQAVVRRQFYIFKKT